MGRDLVKLDYGCIFRSFLGFKRRFPVETGNRSDDRARKTPNASIKIGDDVVVIPPGDGDSIFCALKLDLEIPESFCGPQLRIVLRHDQ